MSGGITLSARAQPSRQELAWTARGIISETSPLIGIGNTLGLASTYVYGVLLGLRAGDVVTNLHCALQGAAAGTDPNFYLGLYSAAGARVALTADVGASASWDTTGVKTFAVTAPYTVTADGGYYVAVLQNGSWSVTQPALYTIQSNTTIGDVIGSGARLAFIHADATTTLPTTLSFTGSGVKGIWLAVS